MVSSGSAASSPLILADCYCRESVKIVKNSYTNLKIYSGLLCFGALNSTVVTQRKSCLQNFWGQDWDPSSFWTCPVNAP